MASSSGTRLPAGASCGSTRRILTPFHFSTNFATLPRRFSNQATSESSTNGYICRVGTSVAPSDSSEDILAIYPSEEKYQESRRVPFTTLFDRFRRALSTPESVTVVCGYSFSDQDINEIIFDAVERFPRSEVVALFFNDISETVSSRAKTSSNLSAAGAKGAILNGREREWEPEPTKYGFWEAETFRLGDFRCLIETLVGGRESPPEIENGS